MKKKKAAKTVKKEKKTGWMPMDLSKADLATFADGTVLCKLNRDQRDLLAIMSHLGVQVFRDGDMPRSLRLDCSHIGYEITHTGDKEAPYVKVLDVDAHNTEDGYCLSMGVSPQLFDRVREEMDSVVYINREAKAAKKKNKSK